jgi:hypothetical protein
MRTSTLKKLLGHQSSLFHLQAPIDADFDRSVIDTSGFRFLRSLDLPVGHLGTLRDTMTLACGLGESLESLSLSSGIKHIIKASLKHVGPSSHPETIWPKLKNFRLRGFQLHPMLGQSKKVVNFHTLSRLTLHVCNGVGPLFADLWQHSQGTTFVLEHLAIQYCDYESDLEYDMSSAEACFLALLALPSLKSLHLAWFFGDDMMEFLVANIHQASNLLYLNLRLLYPNDLDTIESPLRDDELSAVCTACPRLRAMGYVLPGEQIYPDRMGPREGPLGGFLVSS